MKYKVLAPIGGTRRFPHEMGEVVTEQDLLMPAEHLIENGFIKELSDEEADLIIADQKEQAEKEGRPFEQVNPSAVPQEQFASNTEMLSEEEKVKKLNFEADLSEAEKADMEKVKAEELAALKKQEDEEADKLAKLEAEKAAGGLGEGDSEDGIEGVSKNQIIAALNKAGVAFDKKANKTELYEKYKML